MSERPVYAELQPCAKAAYESFKYGYLDWYALLRTIAHLYRTGEVDGALEDDGKVHVQVYEPTLARAAEIINAGNAPERGPQRSQREPIVLREDVKVLHGENGILALYKPAGLCSEGERHYSLPNMWQLARRHIGSEAHTAHRIDRWTSGINLAGATKSRVAYLQGNWHGITRKVYLAVIREPDWSERVVDRPIKGKSAVSSFRVLERADGYALVRCELVQNGRTHQLRRHLKSLGAPIVGDRKYKGPKTSARRGQLLHAWQMEVRLPDAALRPDTAWTTIQAPVPADFREFPFGWDRWDAQANDVLASWEPTV